MDTPKVTREDSRTASKALPKSTSGQHSPLPWRLDVDRNDQIEIYSADDLWIALMPHQCLGSIEEEQKRNAAFIVTAVNAHADLLAACKECREVAAAAMRVVADLDSSFLVGSDAEARQLRRCVEEMRLAGGKNGFGTRADAAIKKAEGQ